jgi:gliding motility-associated-like protein
VRYIIVVITALIHLTGFSQLTSPLSSAVRFTSYPSSPAAMDQIFIFCNVSGSQKGSIEAASPGGAPPYDFSWYRWSDITKSFSIFIKTDASASSSALTSLDEGGYQVQISDGSGYDTSLAAWIHIDKPYAEAKLQNFTCDYVALSGLAAIDTFYYRDPANGNLVKLRNAYAFMWSSQPSSAIPNPSIEINPVTYSPPLEDVVYKLQVTDSFLCVSESSFPYVSIHTKAEFTYTPDKGEAPLEVAFTDKSIRGASYYWEFGDHSTDSVSTLVSPEPHIYYRPGIYEVKLTVVSDKGCKDLYPDPDQNEDKKTVEVEPSELDIPNVFTPDGDGINDFFIVESKSLRTINVEIFSRSGIKVYSFRGEGQVLADWKGWDGNVSNSSVKAAPGVYFFVIRARGWDDKIYDNSENRGFLYLYR